MEGWEGTREFPWGSGTILSSVDKCMFMAQRPVGGQREFLQQPERERGNDLKISSNLVHEREN